MHQKTCRNLAIPRKTSKAFELHFTKDNTPCNITGWTIYMTVKQKMEDADDDALIKKDITNHSDPANGITVISLSTADTDLRGDYPYDIKFKDNYNNAGILFSGRILFRETVTTRG